MMKHIFSITVLYVVVCILCLGSFVAPSAFQRYRLYASYDSIYLSWKSIIESDSSYRGVNGANIDLTEIEYEPQHFSVYVSKSQVVLSGTFKSIDSITECSLYYIDFIDKNTGKSRGGSAISTTLIDSYYGKRVFENEVLSKLCKWDSQFPPVFDTTVYFLFRNIKIITCSYIILVVLFFMLGLYRKIRGR